MRIMLLHPNFDTPLGVSIGISYLGAVLRRAGHSVKVLHLTEVLGRPYELEEVLEEIRKFDPGLVGIGCGHNHYPEMCDVIRETQRRLGIPVVLGGVHATLKSREVMEENPTLSYVCLGEGEEALAELADALEAGHDPSGIENLGVRDGGRVQWNRVRPFLDLGALPPMANDLWEFQRITDLRRGWVNVSAQRGCPYRCTYCHNNGVTRAMAEGMGKSSWSNSELGYLRQRPPEDMVAELEGIAAEYTVSAFSFIDDTFTMNKAWLEEFLGLYSDRLDLPYVCNTTAVDLDDRIVKLLADSGCRVVRLGVESGSQRLVDDLLRRHWISPDRLKRAFRSIQDHGMHALAFNMIGNLGETREEMLSTFRFNADLRPTSMRLSVAYPFPGTEYEERARAEDAIDPEASSHNYLTLSLLRQDDERALWLDKARTFYFWHVNSYLPGEAGKRYEELARRLEGIGIAEWRDPERRQQLWRAHEQLSEDLQERDVFHYTTPFPERTDIVVSSSVVADHAELMRKEASEPH